MQLYMLHICRHELYKWKILLPVWKRPWVGQERSDTAWNHSLTDSRSWITSKRTKKKTCLTSTAFSFVSSWLFMFSQSFFNTKLCWAHEGTHQTGSYSIHPFYLLANHLKYKPIFFPQCSQWVWPVKVRMLLLPWAHALQQLLLRTSAVTQNNGLVE